ncbi:MAG TPA: hypothetical protein VFL92_03725 [Sphingomonas sp.]|nr:hypothetical protein [Sphingomonas sp.]
MAKPPPSTPHSDIEGVNRDARAGVPNRDPKKGSSEEKHKAEQESKARPPQSEEKAGGAG